MAGSQTDITEGKVLDPLTRLPNRLYFIDRLESAIETARQRDKRFAVLFVDLPGGSCLTGAVHYARGKPELAVVTGVNLAMLLDFVFHRDVPPSVAAERAAAAGARAIRTPAA